MRALLVVNTFATTTTPAVQSVISAALQKHLDLTVVNTTAKNDAITMAELAAEQKFEVVIGLGGDGTINELANGILNSKSTLPKPILAGIPGGNANVFLQNLGFSPDPVTATAALLEKLEQESRRVIGVGKLTFEDQCRWFLFNAGFGIDARVLAKMEARRYKGKKVSDLNYALLAFRELLSEIVKTHPTLVIKNEAGIVFDPVQFALIMNFSPWTYVGSTAISPLAKISNTQSLDVFAPRFLSLISLARVVKDLISMRVTITDQQNIVLLGEKILELSSEIPIWAQVDGEPLVKVTSARVEHFADCLTVLA